MARILALALAGLPFLGTAVWAGIPDPPPVAVPEPASLAVLAVGAGAVLIARMRRK